MKIEVKRDLAKIIALNIESRIYDGKKTQEIIEHIEGTIDAICSMHCE